jgi:hypothetical protein
MMSERTRCVRLEIGPSLSLTAFLLAAHAVAGALLVPLDMSYDVTFPLLAALTASCVHSIRSQGLRRTGAAVVALEAFADRHVRLLARNGTLREGQILTSSYVTPRLTILNLRVPGGRLLPVHVVLVADNTDPESFRALRVLLRWSAVPTQ